MIKVCADLLVHGPLAMVWSWQFAALIVIGGAGLLLHQLSLQAGPLTASLPAFTVVDPLLSVGLGVVVFDERLRHGAFATVAEAGCLALLCVAAVALTRSDRTALPAR